MTGPRHQATVPEPVQQVVRPGQAVEHTELCFHPTPQILAAANAVVRVGRGAIEVLANLRFLVGAQVTMIAASATVRQAFETVGVVSLHPFLHRASVDAGGVYDLRRRSSLLGQDHHL